MKAELANRIVKSMILYYRTRFGPDALEQAVATLRDPVPPGQLEDEHGWISFEQGQDLIDALTLTSGDPDFPRKAGRATASKKVLGVAYSMLKAFGGPAMCYRETLNLGRIYNRVGTFSILKQGKTRIAFTYTSATPEPNRHFCEYRMGQFEAFPTIWGLPPARAQEFTCQARGNPCCSYEFEWIERPLHLGAGAGLLCGALVGALLNLAGFELLPLSALVAGGAGLGTAFGLFLENKRQVRQRDQLLGEQNEDMLRSLRDLQQRFDELQILNATLDTRVADRTAELEVTSQKLTQSLARQVELDKAKTHFFTNISHELRTPLTLILAPLEQLIAKQHRRGRERDGTDELEMMHRNGLNLLKNINALLDLSRLDARKERLKLSNTEAARFVHVLVEAAQGLAEEKGVELLFHENEPVGAFPCDRDKLEKILLNLVSNAIKFTASREGPGPRKVTVTCIKVDHHFRLTVEDTGIGIPSEELANIFERFHMVGGAGRAQEGTGIGLSLVKELVDLHMGTIRVESKIGEGTTFVVEIPTQVEVYPADRLDRRQTSVPVRLDRRDNEELSGTLNDSSALALTDLNPATIEVIARQDDSKPLLLVVDDNRDMRSFLEKVLLNDYRVETAQNADEAFRKAITLSPALMVSDVNMPGRTGHELLKDLRAEPRTKHIPVILLTANAERRLKIAGLDEGADDYVTKPFDLAELRARIRSLLQQRQMERELAEKNDFLAKVNYDLVLSRKEVFLQTIETLAFSIEAKDPYTHGHSRRVAILSDRIAEDLGFTSADRERVRVTAVLHDVGKIGIPEAVLCKPGHLTAEEIEVIKLHPFLGACILNSVTALSDISDAILHHHERFDGSGYPGKQSQAHIPLWSRVLAVADTYDAMTSTRCYRKQLSHETAIAEIERCRGSQFDPDCADAFLRLFRNDPPVFPEFPSLFKGIPHLAILDRLRVRAGDV